MIPYTLNQAPSHPFGMTDYFRDDRLFYHLYSMPEYSTLLSTMIPASGSMLIPIRNTGFTDFPFIEKDSPYAMHRINANREPILLSIAHASAAITSIM